MADRLVMVPKTGSSHLQVTRLNRVTEMCVAAMSGDGLLSNFLLGYFYRGDALRTVGCEPL